MLTLCLGLALGAAPPPAAKALQLAQQQQWEELYLAFATAQPQAYPAADRPRLAKALSDGCVALVMEDAVMAFSLAEKATAFAPTAEGLYCEGLAGQRAEQRAAAEAAFRTGIARFPKDYRFPLELGRLFAEEGDVPGARAALAKVPPKAKEFEAAQSVLKGLAKKGGGEDDDGARPGPARHDDDGPPPRQGPAAGHGVGQGPPPSTGSRSYESSVDDEGRRVRANQFFRFRYFNAQRDFGQRAEYEGRVQAALDEARRASERILGVARSTPTDVILYSRQEFELHHGTQAAMAIAGFYSGSAIRMNDTAEITPRNQTVLVHEYVHAVIDELAHFNGHAVPIWFNEGLAEYTAWQYEGREGPEGRLDTALKQQALQGSLPSLSSMAQGALINSRNPALAYAYAASAVKVLVAKRGMREVIELIRECGAGAAFPHAYAGRYGGSLEEFDAEVRDELKR